MPLWNLKQIPSKCFSWVGAWRPTSANVKLPQLTRGISWEQRGYLSGQIGAGNKPRMDRKGWKNVPYYMTIQNTMLGTYQSGPAQAPKWPHPRVQNLSGWLLKYPSNSTIVEGAKNQLPSSFCLPRGSYTHSFFLWFTRWPGCKQHLSLQTSRDK